MCLTNITKLRIIDEPIVVYKHITIDRVAILKKYTIKYLSFYQNMAINFNTLYQSVIGIQKVDKGYITDNNIVLLCIDDTMCTNKQVTSIDESYNVTKFIVTQDGIDKLNLELNFINNENDIDRNITYGFHSYVQQSAAMSVAREFGNLVVKCIIPKGSVISHGSFNNTLNIVSNQIIYDKIVNNYLGSDINKIIKRKNIKLCV